MVRPRPSTRAVRRAATLDGDRSEEALRVEHHHSDGSRDALLVARAVRKVYRSAGGEVLTLHEWTRVSSGARWSP
jgi:hypothetical protein